jgi:hypothetical protein
METDGLQTMSTDDGGAPGGDIALLATIIARLVPLMRYIDGPIPSSGIRYVGQSDESAHDDRYLPGSGIYVACMSLSFDPGDNPMDRHRSYELVLTRAGTLVHRELVDWYSRSAKANYWNTGPDTIGKNAVAAYAADADVRCYGRTTVIAPNDVIVHYYLCDVLQGMSHAIQEGSNRGENARRMLDPTLELIEQAAADRGGWHFLSGLDTLSYDSSDSSLD